jgi:hypothetical protein
MNFRISYNAGKFLSSCTVYSFSRRAQLREWLSCFIMMTSWPTLLTDGDATSLPWLMKYIKRLVQTVNFPNVHFVHPTVYLPLLGKIRRPVFTSP